MRSTALIVTILGLGLTGCVVNVGGPGGGGGDDNQPPTPRLDLTVDKPTVTTELNKSEMVTLTLTGANGFGEAVTLNATLVDAANMPITAVTLTGPTSATVPQDGSTTAAYALMIPPNATGMDIAATLKVDVTSSLGLQSATSAITLAAVYTLTYADGVGATVANHPMRGATLTLKRGAILHIVNADNTPAIQHVTHADAPWPHQDPRNDPTTALVGTSYDINTNIAPVGSSAAVGCHTHEAPADYFILTTE